MLEKGLVVKNVATFVLSDRNIQLQCLDISCVSSFKIF